MVRPPAHLWGDLLRLPRETLGQYNLFSGHFYRPLHQYLGEDLEVVLFLRNPIERSISHFEHVLRSPDHYFHEHVARHRSFLEFVLDPLTRPMVENFQVRSVTCQFDPVSLAKTVEHEPPERHAVEQLIETLPIQSSPETALIAAKDYVTRALVIGLTEHFNTSIACVATALSLPVPSSPPQLNVAPQKSVSANRLSSRELDEVILATQLDWALYEHAAAMFQLQLVKLRIEN